MTEEQFKEDLKNIKDAFKKKKNELLRKCVEENAIYKIGDIIKNSNRMIKIKNITVDYFTEFPHPVYVGLELKKDGSPKKKNIIGSIHQTSSVLVEKAEECK